MPSLPVVFNLDKTDRIKKVLCEKYGYSAGELTIHHFPDQEILISIHSDIGNKDVIFILSTDHPNEKLALLIFAAETARTLGAKKIGLITPYLAYMRQDIAFHPGEGVSSQYFASVLSTYFDWLVTVDPHLHRWHSLDQVFTLSAKALHATKPIAAWINNNIQKPLLIGPDDESSQWVSEIAKEIQTPFLVVKKTRVSDTLVHATIPTIEKYADFIPVLVDDIISTAKTMIETVNHLKQLGKPNIHCVGVHAIFANDAYQQLQATGVSCIATCNTISHVSNKIDLGEFIADAVV